MNWLSDLIKTFFGSTDKIKERSFKERAETMKQYFETKQKARDAKKMNKPNGTNTSS